MCNLGLLMNVIISKGATFTQDVRLLLALWVELLMWQLFLCRI